MANQNNLEAEEPKDSKQHNDFVFSYYDNHCKSPQTLLEELQSLPSRSPANQYNQAVLNYYEENFGRSLSLLRPLYNVLDSLNDYLAMKICYLLMQVHIGLGNPAEGHSILENMEHLWLSNPSLMEEPDEDYFTPLILGTWMGTPSSVEIGHAEFVCLLELYQCKFYLMEQQAEPAKKALNLAEGCWRRLNKAHYSPEIIQYMEAQYLASKHYMQSEIAYIEGNMALALQTLNQGQVELVQTLKDLKSHPSCLRTNQKISHPIYFFNNLGCIHIRLSKPRLARLYFNKGYETLTYKQSIDTKNKNNTITHYSSARRAELLYNSALALLQSNKPLKALECLQEVASVYCKQALFWYKMAQCYCCLHLKRLESGRLGMISDVAVMEQGNRIHLPAKALFKFQEEEKSSEEPLEGASKCLRNALSLCKDDELKVYILLLLSYVSMNNQPQCTLSAAQQLLHMEVTDKQRCEAALYASEALLALGKPRQAIEYLNNVQKDLSLYCHSTLSPSCAVFTEEVSSRYVQSINLSCAQLHAANVQAAIQELNTAMALMNLNYQPPHIPQSPVPTPILSLAIYIALRMGNHELAERFVRTRQVYTNFPFDKPQEY